METRAQVERKMAQKEKEKHEEKLREMAQKARERRAGIKTHVEKGMAVSLLYQIYLVKVQKQEVQQKM